MKLALTILFFLAVLIWAVRAASIRRPSNRMSDHWKRNDFRRHDNYARAQWDSYWK